MVNTTLKVSVETLEKLKKLKIHPRQPIDEVIKELITLSSAKLTKKNEEKKGGILK